MFVGREGELEALRGQFVQDGRTAVLVYGKRRVGKSTLIAKAAEGFDGVVVSHLCVQSSFEGNLEYLGRSVSRALGLPRVRFDALQDAFDYLGTLGRRVLVVLDEYQYLKDSLRKGEVDSLMQLVVDALPPSVKVVLCGSYATVMKELLEEESPLFGRFTSIVHVEDFDYRDAARFYPSAEPNEKVALYSVFGGSPYVLSSLDPGAGVRANVERLLLSPTGLLRTHVENVMLKEVGKAFDIRILEALSGGRKRYSEIQSVLGGRDTGALDKQLKALVDMETVGKVFPINRRDDRRKQFYEVKDNLMRFYFGYLFGNSDLMAKLGEAAFFDGYVGGSLKTFVSKRFEDVARQYFSRLTRSGSLKGVRDLGTYWYDDPRTRTNGEFDCVLDRDGRLDFYECKYYSRPMTRDECRLEEEQVRKVPGVDVGAVGFVCSAGFDFTSEEYDLVGPDRLFGA